jgi:hypothetical protein
MAMRYWKLVLIPGIYTLLTVPIQWLFCLLYGSFIWPIPGGDHGAGLKRRRITSPRP